MEKLIELLKVETENLKNLYIEKCKDWADRTYSNYSEDPRIHKWENKNSKTGFSYSKKNYGKTRTEDNNLNKMVNILNGGRDNFISKSESDAIIHYDNSILKLSHRILKKDLDLDNLKLTSSNISNNIETTISDGKKSVRAFTVLAYGEIQKPHYRYLVR
jgi:arsenate reductase-like glutaredoxin family protein